MLCSKLVLCSPSQHLHYHTSNSITENFCMKPLGFISHDSMALDVMGKYKEKHSIQDLLKHCYKVDIIYNDLYIISRTLIFFKNSP